MCSRLLEVGRANSGKMFPPVVSTDTFIGAIEQTLPFKIVPFIPCEHSGPTLSITHDELDARVLLTVILPD